MAEEIQLSNVVKASLVFRDDFNATRHYPHILKVSLRLENGFDADVFWGANATENIEAELFGPDGKPVPQPPGAASIESNQSAYLVPYGSRLDWLISHGGVSMVGDIKNNYALVVGSRGWLVPIEKAKSYSLRIRLRGVPWARTVERADVRPLKLLVDLPPAPLEVTKTAE
jgi:hypothetical protein